MLPERVDMDDKSVSLLQSTLSLALQTLNLGWRHGLQVPALGSGSSLQFGDTGV